MGLDFEKLKEQQKRIIRGVAEETLASIPNSLTKNKAIMLFTK